MGSAERAMVAPNYRGANNHPEACGGGPQEKPDEYRRRSPLTWLDRARRAGVPVYLATGIHDGWVGFVPEGQSFRAYNALADKKGRIGESDIATVEAEQKVPDRLAYAGPSDPFYGQSARIHFLKRAMTPFLHSMRQLRQNIIAS